MKKVFLSILLMVIINIAYSQTITISGYVSDAATGERLVGASVYNKKNFKGSITNAYGFYSIKINPADSAVLIVSYLGYSPESLRIDFSGERSLNFRLRPGVELEGVEISANQAIPIEQRNEMSVNEITPMQIKTLPALGGEPDLMKAFQLMPGVSGGGEGSSAIYVRGGSPDQNLIILDDVPLYYIDHLGGFVSTFNSDAINSVRLTKGGFPARFGGRLSSVMDIRMKEGNANEFKGNATVGMIVSKVFVEGSIKPDTTSYMISARRFMYDLITRPLSRILFDGISIGYYFYDVNTKVNHRLSSKDHLYFSFYAGNDKFGWSLKDKSPDNKSISKDALLWGNMLSALRWNRQFSNRLFGNVVLYHTRYRYQVNRLHQREQESYYSLFSSGIQDLSLKCDIDFYVRPGYKMNFGTQVVHHIFSPGLTSYQITGAALAEDTVLGAKNAFAWENSAYIENDIEINDMLSINVGFRATSYVVNGKSYFSVDPRLFGRLKLGTQSSLKASWSSMQQYVHLLTSTGAGLPTDLWVPATEQIRPARSHQLALGYSQTLPNQSYELNIEAYYKAMSDLIAYQSGATYLGSSLDWQDKVESNGRGCSYGLEVLLRKTLGKTTGWISYTLSKTTRQFENQNDGKPYPFKYDRRHDIGIVILHKLRENVDFSASWMFNTGNAFTMAAGKYDILSDPEPIGNWNDGMDEVHIYPGVNTFRLRSFHRLDIGFNFHKQKKKGKRTWNISIYNVYNRQNPFFYYFVQERHYDMQGNYDPSQSQIKLMQLSQFPIIPSVAYSFSF